MAETPRPTLLELSPDNDAVTLVTLYELDQLNPRTFRHGTPSFPCHVIVAAARALDRVRMYTPDGLREPPLMTEDTVAALRAVFQHSLRTVAPKMEKTSGFTLRPKDDTGILPGLRESIIVSLNNLVEFKCVERVQSTAPAQTRDSKTRWALPGGEPLIEHYICEGLCRENTQDEVDQMWSVEICVRFGNSPVFWHAQAGNAPRAFVYKIAPQGRIVAAALLRKWASSGAQSLVIDPETSEANEETARTTKGKLRPATHHLPTPAITADQAVARIKDEWATTRQLAEVTGKSQSSIRSAFHRAREAQEWIGADEKDIPNSRPGTARVRYRIRGVWKFISSDRERSQEN